MSPWFGVDSSFLLLLAFSNGKDTLPTTLAASSNGRTPRYERGNRGSIPCAGTSEPTPSPVQSERYRTSSPLSQPTRRFVVCRPHNYQLVTHNEPLSNYLVSIHWHGPTARFSTSTRYIRDNSLRQHPNFGRIAKLAEHWTVDPKMPVRFRLWPFLAKRG